MLFEKFKILFCISICYRWCIEASQRAIRGLGWSKQYHLTMLWLWGKSTYCKQPFVLKWSGKKMEFIMTPHVQSFTLFKFDTQLNLPFDKILCHPFSLSQIFHIAISNGTTFSRPNLRHLEMKDWRFWNLEISLYMYFLYNKSCQKFFFSKT